MEQPKKNASVFFRKESNLKCLPMTSKAASGYFGKVVWYQIKRNVPRFEKSILTRTIKFQVKYLRAQVNLNQLPAETTGILYLRTTVPAAIAGIFARAGFTV